MTAVRTTCPYCGVGCGLVAARAADGESEIRGDPRASRELRARSAPKGRRSARRSASKAGCCTPRSRRPRNLGPSARGRRERLRSDDCGARRRLRSVLRVRPAPHGGLLRREQADEGLHRQRQHRHEFAALHGVGRRGLQARVRRRHRAERLHGSRASRAHRARRLESRVVPSRAVSARQRREGRQSRSCASSSSTRAARRPADDRRSLPPAAPRHRRRLVQRPVEPPAARGCARSRVPRRAHGRLRRRVARREGKCGIDSGRRRGVRARRGRRARVLPLVRAHAADRHRVLARRESIDERHRQGQRDHQRASRDGPHRQGRAWGRSR